MTKSTLDTFISEAPEVQKAYANFIQTLISDDGLDSKTKQLIYIGMKMIVDDEKAIVMHVQMAKNVGATREEIKTTILLGLTIIGLKAVSKYLPLVLDAYDSNPE